MLVVNWASDALVNFLCRNRMAKELADQRTSPKLASPINNFLEDGDFLRISLMDMVAIFMREGG